MIEPQAAALPKSTPVRSATPLCFLMDEDFVFRQALAQELRRGEIDVVQFSNSSRFMDMVEEQNPHIVFINLDGAAPHECVRALLALKETGYAGAVQIFGRGELKTLASLNLIGADCSLKMLPPIQKPIKAAAIQRIIRDQKLGESTDPVGAIPLTEVLSKNLIRFLYQPKFDLRSNKIIGAEVVARVAHPQRGLLTPDQFLKGADEDALLQLTRLALVNAVKTSAHFQQMGVSLQLAINVSADNLLRLPIADLVLAHRPDCEDWPGLLLEISERQVVNKIELLKARWPRLQQSGVSIAVDNFGRGSSCLHILNQIPFAEFKIDRSVVEGCGDNSRNAAICKTLVQTAANFDSKAVAVGISAEADLRTLVDFNCHIGQGFLLSKPLDLHQTEALIASFKNRPAQG